MFFKAQNLVPFGGFPFSGVQGPSIYHVWPFQKARGGADLFNPNSEIQKPRGGADLFYPNSESTGWCRYS